MFDQALGDMATLTSTALTEFQETMKASLKTSFLQTSNSKEGNVKVVESDIPYPTVASMVQDMETRRDRSETLAKAKITELKLSLLKALNEMIRSKLTNGIS